MCNICAGMCRATLLKMEEEWIERTCSQIVQFKPDVVITEKGLSDLAAHFLTKAGAAGLGTLARGWQSRDVCLPPPCWPGVALVLV